MVESTANNPSEEIVEISTFDVPKLPAIKQLPDWDMPKPQKELEFEQKMIKVICEMPESCCERFKGLYMLSEDCIRIKEEFMQEVTKLKEKTLKKRIPILIERDKVIEGKVTDFD